MALKSDSIVIITKKALSTLLQLQGNQMGYKD